LKSISLCDVFLGLAGRWRDRAAVVSPHLRLSYGELISRAAKSARELRERGVVAGTKVGIAVRDGAEAIDLMIAIWMLDATAVPIDFRLNPAERASLVSEFDLGAILEDRQLSGTGYQSIPADTHWTELIARHDGSPICPSAERSAALISLTSGTTGRPMGVILDHPGMFLRSICDIPLSYSGSLLNPLPLSYSASRSHTFSALLCGSTVFFHPVLFSAEELAESILAWEVTSVCAVPVVIRKLLHLFGDRPSQVFHNLNAFYSVGAPMLPEEKLQAKRILCDNVVEDYGSSLAGRISSLCGEDLERRPDSVGRVMPFVALQIVDANGQILPSGETGVIRVRAPGMASAIYGNVARDSGDKLSGGWAYPGDIGSIDDSGFVRLLGRTADLIIRSSVNVYPAEVEHVISGHEGVREVAVVGFAKLPEGQEIAAFVVGSDDLTEAALIAHCRVGLSQDKRPRKFVFVKELPRNANGKISRTELQRQLERIE
jgi:long-chain acyl-CoA synthetase